MLEGNRSIGLGWAHTAGETDEAPAGASAAWDSGYWSGSRHTERQPHTARGCYLSVGAPGRISPNIAHLDIWVTGKRRN